MTRDAVARDGPSTVDAGLAVHDLGRPLTIGMPQSPNHPAFWHTLPRRHGEVGDRYDGAQADGVRMGVVGGEDEQGVAAAPEQKHAGTRARDLRDGLELLVVANACGCGGEHPGFGHRDGRASGCE